MAHPIEPLTPRDEPPFSNSSDGESWMESWCHRCVHDRDAREDGGPGCPLVAIAYCGQTPAEWTEEPAGEYHCVMFRDEDSPGGGEPEPIPDPPDQGALFDRPAPRVRMLAQPDLVEATS